MADLCAEYKIPFVLGHALYMKAIHGGKTKTDKIDSQEIALLLRGGMFPQAYVYPAAMRATRDLLRRRTRLVRTRAEALAHIQNTLSQYNLPPIGKKRPIMDRGAAGSVHGELEERSGAVFQTRGVEMDLEPAIFPGKRQTFSTRPIEANRIKGHVLSVGVL